MVQIIYPRKRYRKKAYKKKTYRKKYIKKPKNIKVHSFTRTAVLATPNMTATTTATGGNISFSLSQVPNYTEWTNLFDSYKIKAVSIKIIPELLTGTLNSGAINAGSLWTAIDRNDLTNPASLNELLQYDTLRRKRITGITTRYLKVNNFSSEDNVQEWNKWQSTANANITYYGLKYWQEALGAGTLPTKLIVKYYLQFKNVI